MNHIIEDVVEMINYNKPLYKLKGLSIETIYTKNRTEDEKLNGVGDIEHFEPNTLSVIIEIDNSKGSNGGLDQNLCFPCNFSTFILDRNKISMKSLKNIITDINDAGYFETLNQTYDQNNFAISNESEFLEVYGGCCSTKYIIHTIEKLN